MVNFRAGRQGRNFQNKSCPAPHRCGTGQPWFRSLIKGKAFTKSALDCASGDTVNEGILCAEEYDQLRDDRDQGERQAPPVPDLLEADFVETEPDAVPAQLTPDDAATKKTMIAALEKFSDYENLKARLSGGQQEALEDIVQMTAYFCRRNVKGKDDGMIEGKANMQFVGSLNRVIARYGDLSSLFEALAVTMDYDTYWKELMKNPRIKNPKLVFQTEVEKALLMPAAVLGEFRARRGQDPLGAPVRDKDVDWLKAFEEV